jgi:hypothetical protein
VDGNGLASCQMVGCGAKTSGSVARYLYFDVEKINILPSLRKGECFH